MTSRGTTYFMTKITPRAVYFKNTRHGVPIGQERYMMKKEFEYWIGPKKIRVKSFDEDKLTWTHREYIHYATKEMNL